MSSSSELGAQRDGPVLNLTFMRAERSNALSAPLVESVIEALGTAESDGTALVVFRGDGANFCSGFDLGDLDQQSDGDLVYKLLRIETLLQSVAHARFATLALAQGKVIGAGCDLFCACSDRVATPEASFRMPGWRFGVALGTRRLVACVGTDAARAVLMETRSVPAEEALRIGLATALAPTEAWPLIVGEATRRATTLHDLSRALLLDLTIADTRTADMAALVESASRPGLRQRIKDFRLASKPSRS